MLRYFGLGVSDGVYALFGFVAYFFVKSFVKETKGRTLEDMSREQDEEKRKHAEQSQ